MAAWSVLAELETPRPEISLDDTRCTACHDMPALVAKSRDGYWHFERVHRVTLDRGMDCRACHSELAPYRAKAHQINPQALTTSCVTCHLAKE